MEKLVEVSGLSHVDATELLWAAYHPYQLWYQFAAIGFISAIGMLLYSRWVKRYEPEI
jgi:hypothetical protein